MSGKSSIQKIIERNITNGIGYDPEKLDTYDHWKLERSLDKNKLNGLKEMISEIKLWREPEHLRKAYNK